MITAKVKNLIRERDQWCWHCGTDSDLVIHHRKNRGSGGSKNPEINLASNLILVCWAWNDAMEAHYQSGEWARGWGHKLASWQDYSLPCFDRYAMTWYVLDNDGGKKEWHHAGRETGLFVPGLPD